MLRADSELVLFCFYQTAFKTGKPRKFLNVIKIQSETKLFILPLSLLGTFKKIYLIVLGSL